MAGVHLTTDAEADIAEVIEFALMRGGPEVAIELLDALESRVSSLSQMPERGVVVGELAALGIVVYREVFEGKYRIIYRVVADDVFVMLVAHGNRDMRRLLERRLLYR